MAFLVDKAPGQDGSRQQHKTSGRRLGESPSAAAEGAGAGSGAGADAAVPPRLCLRKNPCAEGGSEAACECSTRCGAPSPQHSAAGSHGSSPQHSAASLHGSSPQHSAASSHGSRSPRSGSDSDSLSGSAWCSRHGGSLANAGWEHFTPGSPDSVTGSSLTSPCSARSAFELDPVLAVLPAFRNGRSTLRRMSGATPIVVPGALDSGGAACAGETGAAGAPAGAAGAGGAAPAPAPTSLSTSARSVLGTIETARYRASTVDGPALELRPLAVCERLDSLYEVVNAPIRRWTEPTFPIVPFPPPSRARAAADPTTAPAPAPAPAVAGSAPAPRLDASIAHDEFPAPVVHDEGRGLGTRSRARTASLCSTDTAVPGKPRMIRPRVHTTGAVPSYLSRAESQSLAQPESPTQCSPSGPHHELHLDSHQLQQPQPQPQPQPQLQQQQQQQQPARRAYLRNPDKERMQVAQRASVPSLPHRVHRVRDTRIQTDYRLPEAKSEGASTTGGMMASRHLVVPQSPRIRHVRSADDAGALSERRSSLQQQNPTLRSPRSPHDAAGPPGAHGPHSPTHSGKAHSRNNSSSRSRNSSLSSSSYCCTGGGVIIDPHNVVIAMSSGEIGRGSFGVVLLAGDMQTGRQFAVKKMRTAGANLPPQLLRVRVAEIKVLERLSHPNIIVYHGCALTHESIDLYMEYVAGGTLAGWVKTYGAAREPLVWRFARGIAQGLAYLHAEGIMHRDVKGSNVLLALDGTPKLADFGCSRLLVDMSATEAESTLTTVCGSVAWMAPEVAATKVGHAYSYPVDIWSFGATVLEISSGERPWPAIREPVQLLFKLVNKELPPMPGSVPDAVRGIISLCLQVEPSLRPTAEQLLDMLPAAHHHF